MNEKRKIISMEKPLSKYININYFIQNALNNNNSNNDMQQIINIDNLDNEDDLSSKKR